MIDLDEERAANERRRSLKAMTTRGPWTIYANHWSLKDRTWIAETHNSDTEETIDRLLDELEKARAQGYPIE